MADTKNHTPPSKSHMPCGPDAVPSGMKRSKFPDGEMNSSDVYDGSKAIFPVMEKDYLDNACGLD